MSNGMNVLRAVIDDLYSFAAGVLIGAFSGRQKQEKEPETQDLVGSVATDVSAEEDLDQEMEAEEERTFRSAGEVFEEKTFSTLSSDKNTLMYIGGNETPVYVQPTRAFDSVIARLPYGAMVMVLEQSGQWTRIVYNEISGWVQREELMDRAAHVYPHFVIGEQNTAHDPNTMRVRAMLDDMFAAGAAELDLQPSEYVVYRLMRKGLSIAWPEIRPRTPGTWHKILRGVSGIHIGVTPKTGAIMEYMYTEDVGHLAYVEAVFPDETITISEVHYPDRGIYNERTLTREEWRELKPIFIQVT